MSKKLDLQSRKVQVAVDSNNRLELKKLSLDICGFGTNKEIRARAYKFLLRAHLNTYNKKKAFLDNENENKCKDDLTRQLMLDVDRTFGSEIYFDDERSRLRNALLHSLQDLLLDKPNFNYFQGMHMLIAPFLLLGTHVAKPLLHSFTALHIRDFTESTFDSTLLFAKTIIKLMKSIDLQLHGHLITIEQVESGHFAISWFLTWFSIFSKSDRNELLPLYDSLIAHGPPFLLFLVVEFIRSFKAQLLECADITDIYGVFANTSQTQIDRFYSIRSKAAVYLSDHFLLSTIAREMGGDSMCVTWWDFDRLDDMYGVDLNAIQDLMRARRHRIKRKDGTNQQRKRDRRYLMIGVLGALGVAFILSNS